MSFIDSDNVGLVAYVCDQAGDQATSIVGCAGVLGPGNKHVIFRGDAVIESAIPVIWGNCLPR